MKPLQFLLAVVDSEYQNRVDIDQMVRHRANILRPAVRLADKNGLYYYFARRLQELNIDASLLGEQRWIEEQRGLSRFKRTVTLLNEVSKHSGIDYVLIKACSTLPHIPRDIDIFVDEPHVAGFVEGLGNRGMKCLHSDVVETTLSGQGYCNVDIYTRICYFTVDFIGQGFLWRSRATNAMFGVDYPGLSKEASFLLVLVHSLFGHRSLSLLDFLHLKNLRNDIRSMGPCQEHASEMGWGSVFDLALGEFDSLRRRIYKDGEVVPFPRLFDRRWLMNCLSMIDGVNMTRSNKLFLAVSLWLDMMLVRARGSSLYNLVRACRPLRNLVLSVGYFVRRMEGDKKSGRIS